MAAAEALYAVTDVDALTTENWSRDAKVLKDTVAVARSLVLIAV